MKTELRISKKDYEGLRAHLLRNLHAEEAAILLAGSFCTSERMILTVREWIPVADRAFQVKGSAFLQIDPEFLAPLVKRCKYERASLILAHSHPFSAESVGFSGIDDSGENKLIPKVSGRVPGRPHGTLVFGRNCVAGRIWTPDCNDRKPIDHLRIVGERVSILRTSNSSDELVREPIKTMYDRQVLVIGPDVQRLIQSLRVAVIGAGGIGSIVTSQLVHVGVGEIIVVDNDVIEDSNRARIISSRPSDLSAPEKKVDIMYRYATECNPNVAVRPIIGSIEDAEVAKEIRSSDFIFCCTDTISSRLVLNRLSYQYLIPLLDLGIGIEMRKDEQEIRTAVGRVMLIQPDGPCLKCMGIVTPEALNAEKIEGGERPRGPCMTGTKTPAPSIICINGVVGSLGITRFLDVFGFLERDREPGRYDMFLPLSGRIKSYRMDPAIKCTSCREIRGFADDLAHLSESSICQIGSEPTASNREDMDSEENLCESSDGSELVKSRKVENEVDELDYNIERG